MKYLSTVLRLFSEAKKYSLSIGVGRWTITRTLLSLYLRSKFSDKEKRVVSHNIHGFTVYSYTYPTMIQLYDEIFLRQVYRCDFMPHAPFIIDCGANIGMAVLYFKRRYPKSTIWAFEPNPAAFELLRMNIEGNQITGVQLLPYALSNIEGPIDFYLPEKKGSLNGSTINHHDSGITIKVEGKKLSAWLPEHDIDILKIDVEGDEEKIIQDLIENNLLKKIKEIVVEYHVNDTTASLASFIGNLKREQFELTGGSAQRYDNLQQTTILHFKRVETSGGQPPE